MQIGAVKVTLGNALLIASPKVGSALGIWSVVFATRLEIPNGWAQQENAINTKTPAKFRGVFINVV